MSANRTKGLFISAIIAMSISISGCADESDIDGSALVGAKQSKAESVDKSQLNENGFPQFSDGTMPPVYRFTPVEKGEREDYMELSDYLDTFFVFHHHRVWPLESGIIKATLVPPSIREGVANSKQRPGVRNILEEYGIYYEDHDYRALREPKDEAAMVETMEKIIADNPMNNKRLYKVRFGSSDGYRGFANNTNMIYFEKDLFPHSEKANRGRNIITNSRVPVSFINAPRNSEQHFVEDEAARVRLDKTSPLTLGFDVYGHLAALSQKGDYLPRSYDVVPNGEVGLIFEPHFVELYDLETKEVVYSYDL